MLEKLDKIKLKLITNLNFAMYGNIACMTEIIESTKVTTAYTNGNIISINPNFWNDITDNDKLFVLAHEIEHIVYLHPLRVGNRDAEIWNYAADITVNYDLINMGFTYDKIHPYILPEFQHMDMTTEDIYDALISDPKKTKQIKKDNSTLTDDIQKSEDNPFEKISAQQKEEIINKVSMYCDTSKIQNKEILRVLKEFNKPEIKWNYLLRKYLNSFSKTKRSYKKPNRRDYPDVVLPSKVGSDSLSEISFYLDSSCSVSDAEIKLFNSEIKFIKEYFNPKTLNIIYFDTHISNVTSYSKYDIFDEVSIYGRGGTCFKCVTDHIKENKPKLAIIFSDMYVDYIPENPACTPIIWVCTGDLKRGAKRPSYGQFIAIDPKVEYDN